MIRFHLLLVLIFLSVNNFTLAFNKGYFVGGGLAFLNMNGKGKTNYGTLNQPPELIDVNLDLNVVDDIITSDSHIGNYCDEPGNKVVFKHAGWGWGNKYLFGLKPMIGYRYNEKSSLTLTLNYYLAKKGSGSGTYPYSIKGPSGTRTLKADMKFNLCDLQLSYHFYPHFIKYLYFTGGIQLALLSANMYAEEMHGHEDYGEDIYSHVIYEAKGKDTLLGLVFGLGYEMPLNQSDMSLCVSINYNLAKYKGDQLFGEVEAQHLDDPDFFTGTKKHPVELGVEGLIFQMTLLKYLSK